MADRKKTETRTSPTRKFLLNLIDYHCVIRMEKKEAKAEESSRPSIYHSNELRNTKGNRLKYS